MRLNFNDKKTFITVSAISLAFVIVFACIIVLLAYILKDDPEDNGEDNNEVSVIEEMNGVWIASVSNIDFPSRPDLSKAELRAEINTIVENVSAAGLDTIFFQVRPSSDALYKSEIFPVSKYLSSDGKLTLDCLEYMIEAADKKNIKVHAWINPLRVAVGGTVEDLYEEHPGRINPDWCVKYADGKIYFDCGNPEVRDLIAEGVTEIVENYDVAGIIFDDYFYPYPQYETDSEGNRVISAFADNSTFDVYGTNYDDIGDWRRDNVNSLVKLCYEATKAADKSCIFGVSPFGIWKNGYGDDSGSATRGSQSYFDIYCDSLAWAKEGYVDYLAPQLYWTAENNAASYTELIRWWSMVLSQTEVPLLVSHAAYRYDEWEEPSGIMTSQVEDAKAYENYKGSIYYGYEEIESNLHGVTDELRDLYINKDN